MMNTNVKAGFDIFTQSKHININDEPCPVSAFSCFSVFIVTVYCA